MSKDSVFLEMAVTLGKLGTCDRAKVGAIITYKGRAISWGYNGAPEGMPHCSENNHGYGGGTILGAEGCKNSIHAEANAIAFAARQGISTVGGTLYCESSPCINCSRLIIASGIQRVVYKNSYRLSEGQDLLTAAGVEVEDNA